MFASISAGIGNFPTFFRCVATPGPALAQAWEIIAGAWVVSLVVVAPARARP